jgi:serine protease
LEEIKEIFLCLKADLFVSAIALRVDGSGLRRRVLVAAALIFFVLVLLAVPMCAFLSNLDSEEGSVGQDLHFGVKSDGGRGGGGFVPGEVLVKFVRGASESAISNLRVGQGAEELYVSPFSSVRRWKVPASKSVEDWAAFLSGHPLVEFAEPNYFRYVSAYPNDPIYIYQWHFDDDHTNNPGGASSNPFGGLNGGGIGMEDAWEVTSGSSSIVVAVLDTGVAYENYAIPSYERNSYLKRGVSSYQIAPDLAGTSFWLNEDEIPGNGLDDDGNGYVDDVNGWDFINNDAHPNDNNFHGTHVTGTIAQTTGNAYGVAGIASHTAIMPVKVLDYKGDGTDLTVADGIYYAVNNGAKIISLSLGGPDPSTILEDACENAYDNGVVVVAASGNDGLGSVDYPAGYDSYVIAVGATRYDETKASYSNFGSSLDLVAPGGDLGVDQNEDGYADGVLQQTFKPYEDFTSRADPTDWSLYYFLQGTSMATPHVSGVAALLLALDSSLTPTQVRHALESTAEDKGDSGRDNVYGWGLIDAKAALLSIAKPHLLLSVSPSQINYAAGQSITLGVTVFNEFKLPLDSTLTLTITGPSGYYVYDFQPIVVEANESKDYSFSWVVPDVAGTYVVEVGLVPAQLSAYDAAWLEIA